MGVHYTLAMAEAKGLGQVGIASRSLAVACAPAMASQSAMSPAPTRTAASELGMVLVFSPGTAGAADQRAHRTPINVDRQPLDTVEPGLPQNVFPWPGRLAPPCSALVARRMVALLDSRPIGRW